MMKLVIFGLLLCANLAQAGLKDDFFSPLSSGFVFGKLTNFPQLYRTQTEEHLPGRVILLDYFCPWTLR